jgi:heptosyltransferase III
MKERGNALMKFLDHYGGIPFVFFGGLLRPKAKINQNFLMRKRLKFLILKTAAIGDMILVSAMIRELKTRYPEATITLICSKSNSSVVHFMEEVNHVVIFEMNRPIKSLRAISKLSEHDILLDFSPWDRIDAVIAFFSNVKYRIGFRRKRMYRHYVYDIAVEHLDNVHEIENYRNLLRVMNIKPSGFLPEFCIEKQQKLQIVDDLFSVDCPNIILHPFAGGTKKEFKEWPLDHWVQLGQELLKRRCNVYISGGKEDRKKAEFIRNQIDNYHCYVIAGKYSLEETAAIIAKASLLVTVNTGIMHLGAAVGTKIIALHGPTSPERWGPLCNNAVIIKSKLECAPCLSLGFEYGCRKGGCMRSIAVEEVFTAIIGVLNI